MSAKFGRSANLPHPELNRMKTGPAHAGSLGKPSIEEKRIRPLIDTNRRV
jgi:hypothetical protein